MAHEGWSNYETWCVALWLDNDRATYEETRAAARSHYRLMKSEKCTKMEAGISLAEWLKGTVEDARPDLGATLFSDLLTAALSEVDWLEIAGSLLCEMMEEE